MTAPQAGDAEGIRPGNSAARDVAEVIADAVAVVPGVAGLHSGMFGEVGTYLPGKRVPGIRIDAEAVEVHISAVYGVNLTDIASAVRTRVAAVADFQSIDVRIEDVVPPPLPHSTLTPSPPTYSPPLST